MSKQSNPDHDSVGTKFSNMLDSLTKWVNRICNIANAAIGVFCVAAFLLLFKRFSDSGWSFFNKKEEINVSSTYYESGMQFWEAMDYEKAEEHLLLALDEMKQSRGEGALETAEVSQKLGALYLDMGKYEESYELLNSAYVTFYDNLGEEDGNTIIAKCQISLYDIETGNIERGFASLNEAYDQTKYITYKIQIAQMAAQCNMRLGDYKNALRWYEVLGNFYRQYSKASLVTVNYYNDCGVLLIALGEYDEALNYLLAAVNEWQSLNIEEELTIANVYTNLAKAYALCDQYENAILSGDKGLSIWKSIYGDNTIYVARMYENLASVYEDMGMAAREMEYLEQALVIANNAVGRNHEVTAEINNAIGNYYISQGEIQSAIDCYGEALEIRKNILGKNNLVTASVYQNLSECYMEMGQNEEGVEHAQEAVSICEFLYGRDNSNTAYAYTTLARAYENMGDAGAADQLVEAALDIIIRHKSMDNIATAQIYQTAGDIYMHQEQFEKASVYYWETWRIYQQIFLKEDSFAGSFEEPLKQLYGGLKPAEEYEVWVERWKAGEITEGEENEKVF